LVARHARYKEPSRLWAVSLQSTGTELPADDIGMRESY
jgi:hypothetical protein